MINPSIIKSFLERPASRFDWVKKLTAKEIQQEWLNGNAKVKTNPFLHQWQGLLLGLINKEFLYFMDMGLGKSKVILDVLAHRRDEWKRCLVLSPNVTTVSGFATEVDIHSDFSCVELVGTRKERLELLKENADIYIINYTGLLTILTDTVNNKWVANPKIINDFSKLFDVVVYDEIHNCKSYKTLTFKVCRKISERMNLRYGLTGTPLNRDPIDLWSQFYLIDLGHTLGSNPYLYREAYFDAKPGYFGGMDYKFKKSLEQNLNDKIASKSIRYDESEANDLPDKVFIKVPITHNKEMKDWNDTVVERNSDTSVIIKNNFNKLRQICSGYVQVDVDDYREDIIFDENPKLEQLVELINDTPPDSKVVVFLDYIKSGEIVSNRLKKEKIGNVRLFGGTADKPGTIEKFKNDPKIKVLVANTASGGVGLNLQVANYAIFFELPLSSIAYKQALKRVHRTGQTKKTFIYSLIVKGSVEDKIERFLKEGRDIFQALLAKQETLK